MSARDKLIEIVTRDPRASGGDEVWATDLVDAYRADILGAAIEAARGEYLHDQTGVPEDEAYNRAVSDVVAAIGALLAAHAKYETEAREKSSPFGADATPDFFEPGHSYTHRDGSTFRCVAVTTHPDSGERVAIGWHTDTANWTFAGVRNINHWNHEYDGVTPANEGGERS